MKRNVTAEDLGTADVEGIQGTRAGEATVPLYHLATHNSMPSPPFSEARVHTDKITDILRTGKMTVETPACQQASRHK